MTSGKQLATRSPLGWWRSTSGRAFLGCFLLWLAFPPLGWSWLAWVAPIPWLDLVRRQSLGTSRPYRTLWLAGLLYWLVILEGIRLAHWLNHFGWFALSAYLAIYLPLFVGLTRAAVHRCRVPLMLAAPTVWAGLELVRGHLLTGFSMALLGHTQFELPLVIQVSDIFGAYAVGFMIVFVAAGLSSLVSEKRSVLLSPQLAWVALGLAAMLGYGQWQLNRASPSEPLSEPLHVGLIQGNFNTHFEYDPHRNRRTFQWYWQQTLAARTATPDLDLIVWPESAFTGNLPEVFPRDGFLPTDVTSRAQIGAHLQRFADKRKQAAELLNRPQGGQQSSEISLLVGTETVELSVDKTDQFNTALLIDPAGEIANRYYKMHPVMFGEYIPFGAWFPFLYRWSPMAQGLTPGAAPAAFEVRDVRLAPSICFESTVPHLIRRQVLELTRQGKRPHALVNLTHDGWFWGSAILDYQLACAVFRAVEMRRTTLVAANAGISAVIDPRGRIVERGPREGEATLTTHLDNGGWNSVYLMWGDLPASLCLLALCAFAAVRFVRVGERSEAV